MKRARTLWVAVASIALALYTATAWAIPRVEVDYLERNQPGGIWRYEYTFRNLSDPILDLGADLYQVRLDFTGADAPLAISTPADWDTIGGSGFVEFFSVMPGTPPAGADIPPGESLNGFDVDFSMRQAEASFSALLANLVDPGNPFVFTGEAVALVPEPATAILLGCGVAGIAWVRRKRQYRGSGGTA